MNKKEIIEYSKRDLLKLEDMSWAEVEDALDSLDRMYFNKDMWPKYDDDSQVYTEDEYYEYRMIVALRKVFTLLEAIKEQEHEIEIQPNDEGEKIQPNDEGDQSIRRWELFL